MSFIGRFPMRILNIHPARLPSFPGLEAQRQAIAHGVKFSGCTVHFVDAGLDSGPIIQQAVVPVLGRRRRETLAARILREEHRIYSEAIGLVLSGNYQVVGRSVGRSESVPLAETPPTAAADHHAYARHNRSHIAVRIRRIRIGRIVTAVVGVTVTVTVSIAEAQATRGP